MNMPAGAAAVHAHWLWSALLNRNICDLCRGFARVLEHSHTLLKRWGMCLQIEGVWHTGLVVDGTEYFFGYGVQRCPAGSTSFGFPTKVLDLG